jgi:glycosyltransferase involved in cell wall biosynthesis
VTPFHNTEAFLPECIGSVLRQTHRRFEYILVDNASDDGSFAIADRLKDDRRRLIRTDRFLSQVQNFNFALTQISADSRCCKMVLADDWIYPECLEKMVAAAEAAPRAVIVSAFTMSGVEVKGSAGVSSSKGGSSSGLPRR